MRARKRRALLTGGLLAGTAWAGFVAPLGAGSAGASSAQVTAVGSAASYVMMHNLFPTSLNDLLPGGTTTDQRIAETGSLCSGGASYGAGDPVPNGSQAGKAALHAEESASSDEQGCIDFVRSSSPPEPGTTTVSTRFDYYAYALDALAPLVGKNAGGTRSSPVTLTLTDLQDIYRCKPGYGNWRTVTNGVNAPIVRFWPPPTSGTALVYSQILGFTPTRTHTSTAGSTCSTAPIWHFTVGGKTVVGEENSEEGIIYQASIDATTPVADAIDVYSVGRFSSQWNTTTHYTKTKINPITGAAIGNFNAATLLLARMQNRVASAATAPFALFTPQSGTFNATTRRGGFGTNTAVVNEGNEWFSHMPTAGSTPTGSSAAVPGVLYVYNVADSALPTYSEDKMMVGFDNQAEGTKSVLCNGDDAATIEASGFVPLNTGSTAPSSSDEAGATCREFPAKSYPGDGLTKSWTAATWSEPTGGGSGTAPYIEQPGFPVINNTSTTLPVTTAAVGDVMLVMAHTAPSHGSSEVTSITDSAGRITWQSAESAGLTSAPSGDVVEIWYGVVKSAGATTIDVHWAGTTFDHFVWADEWRSVAGSSATWSVAAAGEKNSSLCVKGSCAFPSLIAGSTPSLYWGWAYPATSSRAGSTPGVSYYITTEPTHGNVLVTDPTVAAAATLTPTFGQVTGTSWYDAAAVLMTARG
jgi:hypothetical protein